MSDGERSVDSPVFRKDTIETLGLLVDRYPNIPIGHIIDNALSQVGNAEVWEVSDEKLARGLNQLFVTYTQFEAAGIKP
jgi:hypothetical protein